MSSEHTLLYTVGKGRTFLSQINILAFPLFLLVYSATAAVAEFFLGKRAERMINLLPTEQQLWPSCWHVYVCLSPCKVKVFSAGPTLQQHRHRCNPVTFYASRGEANPIALNKC